MKQKIAIHPIGIYMQTNESNGGQELPLRRLYRKTKRITEHCTICIRAGVHYRNEKLFAPLFIVPVDIDAKEQLSYGDCDRNRPKDYKRLNWFVYADMNNANHALPLSLC